MKRDPHKMNELYSSCIPLLSFSEEVNIIIITGRKITFKDVTVQWLKESHQLRAIRMTRKGVEFRPLNLITICLISIIDTKLLLLEFILHNIMLLQTGH